MFRYSEYAVCGYPSFFIKKLWTLDNTTNPLAVEQKSILPNGCFNIAIINGQGISVRHQGKDFHLERGVYFCGQMTKALKVAILSGTKATMIQLFPWTPVYFLLRLDLSPFTNSVIPIHKLALNLPIQWEHLLMLSNETQIYRYFVVRLGRLSQHTPISHLITDACRLIIEHRGMLSVNRLAAELHCSTRHLQRLFKPNVGLSPKDLTVIIKLRESADHITYANGLNHPKLTDLALVNQFYDQAHFINSFRAIAGTTPKKFKPGDYFLSFKK